MATEVEDRCTTNNLSVVICIVCKENEEMSERAGRDEKTSIATALASDKRNAMRSETNLSSAERKCHQFANVITP